jgi:hypothetical protein
MVMTKIKHVLHKDTYTSVYCSKENVPINYCITSTTPKGCAEDIIADIMFQDGAVENGVNGVCAEDLLLCVLLRLQAIQNTRHASKKHEQAIDHIKEALVWLY